MLLVVKLNRYILPFAVQWLQGGLKLQEPCAGIMIALTKCQLLLDTFQRFLLRSRNWAFCLILDQISIILGDSWFGISGNYLCHVL